MKHENRLRKIERQDLVMVAKTFAGQKTTIDRVQKYGGWGYNRSAYLLKIAVELGFAYQLERTDAVEFKRGSDIYPHQEELPLLSVKEDPPQLGQVVLAFRPTRKIDNGYEIVEWQEDDEDVYASWYPLVRPTESEDNH
jgi:hypothetical protein